jgi:secretion/DNA translocation related CpaE-like protein
VRDVPNAEGNTVDDETHRPVALIDDDALLDDVLRLAAAADCAVDRVPDVPALRGRWSAAPLVLLDERAAAAAARAELPRRAGVLLVGAGPPGDGVWQHAVALGAERVLDLPDAEQWLVEAFADVLEHPGGTAGRVLAVLGGRGGAGASVLAAAVGRAVLRSGGRALLVDCDPLGGGLDLALGVEGETGLRWPGLRLSGGRVAASALRSALPGGSSGLTVLSCDRDGPGPEPHAVAAVVDAGRRGGDTVVCDLPRQLTDAACAALDRADLAVLVVPAEVRACAAATRVARRAAERGARPRVLVRGPSPGGLRSEQVAAAIGLPLLTSMRPEPGLASALDRGTFPDRSGGPLATAAAAVLRELMS